MLKDDLVFDSCMNNQRYPLECGIAGMENMNFLYNTVDFGQSRNKEKETKFNLLKSVMRDGMLRGYRQGYLQPKSDLFKLDETSTKQAYLLIELALVLTHDQRG